MDRNSNQDDTRAVRLIHRLLDNVATNDDVQELLVLINQSEAAQREWEQAVIAHADLGSVLNPPRAFSREELAVIEKQSQLSLAEPRTRSRVVGGLRNRLLLWPLAIAASTLLAIFGVATWFPDPDQREVARPQDDAVGLITRSVGSDLSQSLQESGSVGLGDYLEFSQGLVELRVNDGVTVVAMGPARFRFVSKEEIRLDFGRLTATVDEGFEGFRLTTSEAVFTDLGTSFSVDADFDGASTLNVHSGEVQVQANKDLKISRRFLEGEAVRISSADRDKQEIAEFRSVVRQPLDSLLDPHQRVVCSEDTYVVGGKSRETTHGEAGQLWVKLDLVEPNYCRRGLVGFDLADQPLDRLVGARLVLTVDPNNYAERIEPSNRRSTCDWLFRVTGVWDDDLPRWNEGAVSWLNAPGAARVDAHGRPMGPRGASPVGTFIVTGSGEPGDKVLVETAELLDFLRHDEDGWVTLAINRLSGFTWSAETEDRIVHSFASKDHPTLPAPMLELWFDEGTLPASVD